jgi:hypothetical protein
MIYTINVISNKELKHLALTDILETLPLFIFLLDSGSEINVVEILDLQYWL